MGLGLGRTAKPLPDEERSAVLDREVSAATLRQAHAVHPSSCVQMEYLVFSTEIESEQTQLLDTCCELGVAVVSYRPLSRSLLSGQIRSSDDFDAGDLRRHYPRSSVENFPRNMALVDTVASIAKDRGATVGQVALAWLLEQGDDIFPIPGTINPRYVEENFAATEVKLRTEEIQHIRDLVEKTAVQGERYSAHFAIGLFADTPLP